MSRCSNVFAGLCLAGLLNACGPTTEQTTLQVSSLLSTVQCQYARRDLHVRWFIEADSLQQTLVGIAGSPDALAAQVGEIDFSRQHVLQVNMGLQTSGGYAIRLAPTEMLLDDGVATLALVLQRPAAGAIVTQALTSPCVFVVMPASGYDQLRLVDQHGRELLQQAMP